MTDARALAHGIETKFRAKIIGGNHDAYNEKLEDVLQSALRTARNDALEFAAKECDQLEKLFDKLEGDTPRLAAKNHYSNAAAVIRALKDRP